MDRDRPAQCVGSAHQQLPPIRRSGPQATLTTSSSPPRSRRQGFNVRRSESAQKPERFTRRGSAPGPPCGGDTLETDSPAGGSSSRFAKLARCRRRGFTSTTWSDPTGRSEGGCPQCSSNNGRSRTGKLPDGQAKSRTLRLVAVHGLATIPGVQSRAGTRSRIRR